MIKVSPHPEYARLAKALTRAHAFAEPWSGEVFRSARPAHSTPERLVSGEGGLEAGGRWNAPGAFRVVYASLRVEVAMEEGLAFTRAHGIPDAYALPLDLRSVRAELQLVLDLSLDVVRKLIAISDSRLMKEDWRGSNQDGKEALTQAVGRAAHAARLEALLVPGITRPDAQNLVIFPGHLRTGSRLEAIEARGSRRRAPARR